MLGILGTVTEKWKCFWKGFELFSCYCDTMYARSGLNLGDLFWPMVPESAHSPSCHGEASCSPSWCRRCGGYSCLVYGSMNMQCDLLVFRGIRKHTLSQNHRWAMTFKVHLKGLVLETRLHIQRFHKRPLRSKSLCFYVKLTICIGDLDIGFQHFGWFFFSPKNLRKCLSVAKSQEHKWYPEGNC